MLRNKEFKSILIKTIYFQIAMALIAVFIVQFYMNKINSTIVDQHQAMVGNILVNHPELEGEIIPYMTKEVSEEKVILGRETLKKYGYHEEINQSAQAVF